MTALKGTRSNINVPLSVVSAVSGGGGGGAGVGAGGGGTWNTGVVPDDEEPPPPHDAKNRVKLTAIAYGIEKLLSVKESSKSIFCLQN